MDRQEDNLTGPAGPAVSRRKALKVALGAAGAVACAGGAAYWLRRASDPVAADVAEVFKNDAPTGELWDLWMKRGWVAEGRYFLSMGKNLQCKTCPNDCLLAPGDRGRCRNKINRDGKLYTLAYANPCAFHLDPIEKKPLYHFLPGTKVFSLSTTGCGFRCLNCQNWDTSQRKPEELKDPRGEELRLKADRQQPLTPSDLDRLSIFPEDVVEITKQMGAPSVACTYSEPTSYFEYSADIAKSARAKKIKSVWVTCGYIEENPLTEVCQWLDAANVDLKSFSAQTYKKLNSGKLEPVLKTLKTMKKLGVWLEVSYLVVPTYADDVEGLKSFTGWVAQNLGAECPVHFLRFHPAHRLTNLPPTPIQTMEQCKSIATAAGLKFVYLGNVREVQDCDTTFCPGCNKPVVERDGMELRYNRLNEGKCASCGRAIPGVWVNKV